MLPRPTVPCVSFVAMVSASELVTLGGRPLRLASSTPLPALTRLNQRLAKDFHLPPPLAIVLVGAMSWKNGRAADSRLGLSLWAPAMRREWTAAHRSSADLPLPPACGGLAAGLGAMGVAWPWQSW